MDRNKKGKSTKPHFMGSGELIALGKNTRTATGSEGTSSDSRKTSSSSSSTVSASKSLAGSSKLFTGGKFFDKSVETFVLLKFRIKIKEKLNWLGIYL